MQRLLALALAAVGGALVAQIVLAQGSAMPHSPAAGGAAPPHAPSHHPSHQAAPTGAPALAGQDAFAALAEVVRLLDADPQTDWTRVDLERLRQHLIDMNRVVLESSVTQTAMPGGVAIEVTGAGRTERAIRTMVVAHAAELDRMPQWSARTEPVSGGVRLVVVARDTADARAVARLRGLGFAGLLTEGAHHGPHHLAMARSAGPGHPR